MGSQGQFHHQGAKPEHLPPVAAGLSEAASVAYGLWLPMLFFYGSRAILIGESWPLPSPTRIRCHFLSSATGVCGHGYPAEVPDETAYQALPPTPAWPVVWRTLNQI